MYARKLALNVKRIKRNIAFVAYHTKICGRVQLMTCNSSHLVYVVKLSSSLWNLHHSSCALTQPIVTGILFHHLTESSLEGRSLSIKELLAETQVTPSVLRRCIRRYEQIGWILSERSSEDFRVRILVPTMAFREIAIKYALDCQKRVESHGYAT